MTATVIDADWDAPPGVRAFTTLRAGGVSCGAYGTVDGAAAGWNLGAACGDAPEDVAANRARLRVLLPAEPQWLEQVHGCEVAALGPGETRPRRADASVTAAAGVVLAVLTADCLPVVFADVRGRAVGVAHAGWRGLAAGVLERTVAALRELLGAEAELLAWLGPAIGPARFEVGDDVLQAFVATDSGAADAFVPTAPGKHHADLFALARRRLAACGVRRVSGGGLCTVSDPTRFYSYRRDGATGRMATVVWRDAG